MEIDTQTIAARLDRPVTMIGLMGAGKTKIGGLLADALGWPFVDADQEIEEAAQCTIAEIFERHGEAAFRDLERRVLARLIGDGLKVIATGGGAVMTPDTAEILFRDSFSIWLRADLTVLLERTARNDKRPLLQRGDPAEILSELMAARYPVYACANMTVESNAQAPEETLHKLLQQLGDHLAVAAEKS